MFLLPSKFAGSSKFWLKLCVMHGGDVHSTWISQNIHIRILLIWYQFKKEIYVYKMV